MRRHPLIAAACWYWRFLLAPMAALVDAAMGED